MTEIRIELADFTRFRRPQDVNAFYSPGDPAFDRLMANPLDYAVANFRVHIGLDSFSVRVLLETQGLDDKWAISRAKARAREMLVTVAHSDVWGISD